MHWLLQQRFNMLHKPAEDDGAQGGGGGDQGGQGSEIDFNDPKIKAAIQAEVDKATSGLTAKRTELLGKVQSLKQQLANFDGIDPEEVRGLLAKIDDDEERDLIGKGEFETVLQRRTDRMVQAHNQTLAEKDTEIQTAQQRIANLTDRAIASAIKGAAAEAGALPKALSDFVSRAKGVFTLDDNYEVVAVDQDGNVIYDADGKTPLSPVSWAKSLREEAPHLFTVANGGGSQGGQGPHTTGKINGSADERAAYFASKYNLPKQ